MAKNVNPIKSNTLIGRDNQILILHEYLREGHHVTIKAPRRFGKTSLIKHVLSNTGEYTHIYIDIRRVNSLEQLANKILDLGYSLAGIELFVYKSQNNPFGLIKEIQKRKVEPIGDVTLQAVGKPNNSLELFLHALDTIEKIAHLIGANIVFVMDEFQEIIRLGEGSLLDKMSSTIKHHKNITYAFLGSVESITTRIFEDKTSPFFRFTKTMDLAGLGTEDVIEHCESYYQWHKEMIVDNSLFALITYLKGHPDYTSQTLQRIHYALLEQPGLVINMDLCIKSLADVFMENKFYLEELAAKSKLKKHHYEILMATANEWDSKLPSATLYQTRSSLEDMGLIRNTGRGEYTLVDIFLEAYLCIHETDKQSIIEYFEENIC